MKENRKLYKDEGIFNLSNNFNVARFVSFENKLPLKIRYCVLDDNYQTNNPKEAIDFLLNKCSKVNVRSFDPEKPEGNPFIQNLKSTNDVLNCIEKLIKQKNLYIIVNESIDEHDGGISGVYFNNVIEFSPDATPRCVDSNNIKTTLLPYNLSKKIIDSIYGVTPDFSNFKDTRIEFSIHPNKCGFKNSNTIIWQIEEKKNTNNIKINISWPTNFSKMIGDKTFGLLIADSINLNVPETTVFNNRLNPFSFGNKTSLNGVRTRTCPEIKEPGYYPSYKSFVDPINLLKTLNKNKPQNITEVKSVIIQNSIDSLYSGRAICKDLLDIDIDGVFGDGDDFMLGKDKSCEIPENIKNEIYNIFKKIYQYVGKSSIEWVFDKNNKLWIVQLNKINDNCIKYNKNMEYIDFYYKDNIEEFRNFVVELKDKNKGINLYGNVSPLSHIGEISEMYQINVNYINI